MPDWRTKDADLTTIPDIEARVLSIRRRVARIEARKPRSDHIEDDRKRWATIAKMNARVDALHVRRACMLRASRT